VWSHQVFGCASFAAASTIDVSPTSGLSVACGRASKINNRLDCCDAQSASEMGHFEPPRFAAVAAELASMTDTGEGVLPLTENLIGLGHAGGPHARPEALPNFALRPAARFATAGDASAAAGEAAARLLELLRRLENLSACAGPAVYDGGCVGDRR
jgi:hypothetical protein